MILKVTFFYLILPPNPEEIDDYYSDEGFFCPIIDDIINNDHWISDKSNYLYAYTDDKNIADIFEELHDPSMFIRIDKKISKEDYENLLKAISDLRIVQYNIRTFEYKHRFDKKFKEFLIATELEIKCVDDEFYSWIEEEIMSLTDIPYKQFKEKYIYALDGLLYCLFYTIYNVSSDDADVSSYDFSYGYTPEGHSGIRYMSDIISMYISLFRPLLRKNEFK